MPDKKSHRTKRPLAYDTRIDGIDLRLCIDCVDLRRYSGCEALAVYEIEPGGHDSCEECDCLLG